MRPLTDREREVLQFGPDYATPGEGIEASWLNTKDEPVVTHYWYRSWWGDDARQHTERTEEREHPFDERGTCEDCARWPQIQRG